jgi:hypothetical protein
MAEYLLLIYEDEALMRELDPTAEAALVGEFQQFMARNRAALRRGQRLHPTSAATSVRREPAGGVRISDGAFIESKEVVAGYFLIKAENPAEALDIAKQIPVRYGGVEIRPIRSSPGA